MRVSGANANVCQQLQWQHGDGMRMIFRCGLIMKRKSWDSEEGVGLRARIRMRCFFFVRGQDRRNQFWVRKWTFEGSLPGHRNLIARTWNPMKFQSILMSFMWCTPSRYLDHRRIENWKDGVRCLIRHVFEKVPMGAMSQKLTRYII